MNCERCEEKYDRIREGQKYGTWDGHYCEDCRDALSEAAWESFCEDYYGGSGPVTVQEHYDAAVRERRELRKRD